MIRFEEHEGQLFRMLEEPVPLTPDAELPCLVRLIQDNSRMGMFNRDTKPNRLSDFYLAARIVNNNIIVDEFMESDYHRFEIIGYPVAEGSAEWALWRLMQGDIVMGSYWGCDVMVTSTSSGWHEVIRLNLYGKRHGVPITDSDFLFHAEKMGWQIYKEPKPEPPKEPDYVICKRCGGSKSVLNPASTTAYTTCPACNGTGKVEKPILCAKCNDHIIANDGAICEVCASTQESVITELQGDIDDLKRRIANAMDSARAAQNCIKIARVDIYKALERIKYILTAPPEDK